MTRSDKIIAVMQKIMSYVGWVLLTICAIQIAWLENEPSEHLFGLALILIGLGVLLGWYRAAKSIRDHR